MRIKELEDQLAEMARLHPSLAAMVSSSSSSASGSGSQAGPSASTGANPSFLSVGKPTDRDRSGSPRSTCTGADAASDLYNIASSSTGTHQRRVTPSVRPPAEGMPYGGGSRGAPGTGEPNYFQVAPDISNDPLPPGVNQQHL